MSQSIYEQLLRICNGPKMRKTNQGWKSMESLAESSAERMREILRDEVGGIRSQTTDEPFLEHIIIDKPKFETNGSFSVAIRFDRTAIERESIFGRKTVYMPYIVNNPWSYGGGSYWGKDRHGHTIATITRWVRADDNGFMQRAVKRFNDEYAGRVRAVLNKNYE